MVYFKRLDSLRAVAVIGVIAFHWHTFLPFGWVGVQFFFVLSGFLITDILRRDKKKVATFGEYVRRFYAKRVLRIVPLYYLFVGLMALGFLLAHHPKSFMLDLPYLLTFTLNLARMDPDYILTAHSHLWSLAVEWQFYMIWPFVVWFFPEKALVRLAILFVLMGPVARFATVVVLSDLGSMPGQIAEFCYNATWSHLDAFAIGALLGFPRTGAVFSKPMVWLPLAGATLWVYYVGSAYDSRVIFGFSLLALLSASLVSAALRNEGAGFLKFADNRVFQHLGKISYGMYIYHVPIVMVGTRFFLKEAPLYSPYSVALLLAVILLTATTAHLSFVYFESIFLRKKSKLAIAPEPAPVVAA